MKSFLNNLLLSGHTFNKEENLLRFRFQLTNASMLLLMLFVILFVPYIASENPLRAGVDGVLGLIVFSFFLLLRRSKNYYHSITRTIFALFLVAVAIVYVIGVESHARGIWFLLIPVLSFFLRGRKESLFWLFTTLILFITLSLNFETNYKTSDLMIVIGGVLSAYIVLLFYELRNEAAHEELEKSNAYLESHIEAKTRSLQELNERLEERIHEALLEAREKDILLLDQTRSASVNELMINIAHHWRQPLNVISLILQQIDDMVVYEEDDKEELQRLSRLGSEHLKELSLTIDRFRNMVVSDSNPSTFALQESLKDAATLMLPDLSEHHITLHTEFPEMPFQITGQRSNLTKAFLSLIKNAIEAIDKTAPAEREIYCHLDAQKRLLKIVDSGGGVDTEILEKIFDPYVSSKHKSPHTGLGLYSAYVSLKQMDARLSVANEERIIGGTSYPCAAFSIQF